MLERYAPAVLPKGEGDMKREIFRRLKRATVAMVVMDEGNPKKPFRILGSGFCVDSAGIVVTCSHVIEAFMSKSIQQQIVEMAGEAHNQGQDVHVSGPASQTSLVRPYAVFFDPEASTEQLVAIPSMSDHAMAKTDFDLGMVRLLPHGYFRDGYPTVEIEDYENIFEGDEIAICGFPLGDHLEQEIGTVSSSFSKGIVSSILPAAGVPLQHLKGFQLNIAATHGNSGGPVFSLDSGKVFGVLARGVGHPSGGILPGIVKAEPVYPVLENNSVERMKAAPRA